MDDDDVHPKVFLSHASEDKERFVVPFATALRARGLAVWVDRWEMLPGDSLVTKIFTEGIDKATSVIVVLSRHSVDKRWVMEELDAAVVKRIDQDARLIPIVLDGLRPVDLPAPVRHLLFEPVADISELEEVVDRTVRAVFGVPERPPLGEVPKYATTTSPAFEGLDRIDSLLFRAMGEEAIRDFGDHFRTEEFFQSVRETFGISEPEFLESLGVLDTDCYINLKRTFGSGMSSMSNFTLTSFGLETYARTCVPDYDAMLQRALAYLGRSDIQQGTDENVAIEADVPRLIARHILRRLAAQGLLGLSEPSGPWAHFHNVSPKIRRMT